MPKVSIIVPVFNAEKYLSGCINSILRQKFNDFELILVDDGSDDDSLNICRLYEQKDSRVKIISKQNGGVSSARNAGIKLASGTYIMFCDSDDKVSNCWCKIMYDIINTNLYDLGICDYTSEYDELFFGEVKKEFIYEANIWDMYLKSKLNSPFNKIFKRSIIVENGIFFSENLTCGEDLDFNLRYINNINSSIFYVNFCLYYYNNNIDSVTSNFISHLWEQRKENFSLLLSVMEKFDLCDKRMMQEYYNCYIDAIVRVLNNNMLSSNDMSIFEKIKLNTEILNDPVCIMVLKKGDSCKTVPNIYVKLLQMKSYIPVYIFDKIYKIWKVLFRKNNRNE